MSITEIQNQSMQVLWLSFTLSLVFGAIAQRTHFCTMGALSDAMNMGDYARLRQWALAVAVAVLGFATLVYAGKIDPSKTLYASTRLQWLSALVGGLLFGLGMVLASGCGSKTLIRMGAGNLKSWVVFLVMGVSAFATLRGITAVARVDTVDRVFIDMPMGASLGAWLAASTGIPVTIALLASALAFSLGLMVWVFKDRAFWQTNHLLAGIGVGMVVVAMWWGSGVLGHVVEHPDTLQEAYLSTNSGRIEAMSFVSPVAYVLDWLMFFSDKSKMLTWGIASVAGVVIGAFVSAMLNKEFRWEGFRDARDTGHHLVGAIFMGVGGVTAMGCTIGQGLSGLSTLSLTSFVAVVAIVLGAKLGFVYQVWLVERSD